MSKFLPILVCVILLSYALPTFSQVNYTANDKVPAYTGTFAYGTNQGYFGNFSDDQMTDNLSNVNVHTMRTAMFMNTADQYGINIHLNQYKYAKSKGMIETLTFVGTGYGNQDNNGTHRDHTKYDGATYESVLAANLYLPIWDNGENGTPVNDNNYYAVYVYNMVKSYGDYIRFYEVVNEPDNGIKNPYDQVGTPGNLFENPLKANNLPNLNAPIYHYIRLMRVTYEIVKFLKPDSYVCTGGIGYESFLDNILRYSDNPDGGKITSAYPLKGGAYFDAMSYHSYPQYDTRYWDNTKNAIAYTRHSDSSVDKVIQLKARMEARMAKYGYGTTYPKKVCVLSEVNVPRKLFPGQPYSGTPQHQNNFLIKMMLRAQRENIGQIWTYSSGDWADESTYGGEVDGMKLMGLYYNLKTATPGNVKTTGQGVAFKTVSGLLYQTKYDAAKTAQLNLPSTTDGSVFVKPTGEVTYVLWAKTKTDLNEDDVSASFTFPAVLGVKSMKVKSWNYSSTNTENTISGSTITLTGYPVFITLSQDVSQVNQSPAVSITSPATNTTFVLGNDIILTADAKDNDGTIAKVEFYQGTTKIGESTTYPYQFTWKGAAVGTYSLTAKAYDNLGAATTSFAVTAYVTDNNQLPVVSISVTAALQTFISGNDIILSANAKDNDGTIAKVEFYQGTTKIGESTTSPYQFTWKTVPTGTYSLTAKAYDNKGAITTSTAVVINVAVSNQLPTIILTNPANNATFSAGNDIILSANAKDNDGTIAKVEFYQGTTKIGESTTSPYQFTWKTVVAGSYSLTAKAYDNLGAATSTGITTIQVMGVVATVPNQYPMVLLTNPVNNATFSAGNDIILSANAKDNDGTIAKVEFYQGTTKIGESTTSPYQFTWKTVAAGSYSLTAKAYDNLGAATSTGITTIQVMSVVATVPNQYPMVLLTNPVNNATFFAGNDIILSANAKDNDGTIAKVEFYQGTTKIGESTTSPYQFTWKTVSSGIYVLSVKAYDDKGAVTSSAVTTIYVNTNQSVSIPANKSPIVSAGEDISINSSEKTILKGSVTDPENDQVILLWTKVSGPDVELANQGTLELSISNLKEGTYVFQLTATDSKNGSGSDQVSVYVQSDPMAIKARRVFAPGQDECWKIENIEIFPNYKILIVNQQGGLVFSNEHLTSSCVWDGVSNGKNVPEGAYYFILKNEKNEVVTTGNFALIRSSF